MYPVIQNKYDKFTSEAHEHALSKQVASRSRVIHLKCSLKTRQKCQAARERRRKLQSPQQIKANPSSSPGKHPRAKCAAPPRERKPLIPLDSEKDGLTGEPGDSPSSLVADPPASALPFLSAYGRRRDDAAMLARQACVTRARASLSIQPGADVGLGTTHAPPESGIDRACTRVLSRRDFRAIQTRY